MIIAIFVILVFVIWLVISINRDNQEIRDIQNRNGGLRALFPNLSFVLKNDFQMNFKYDDGRKFCYSKITEKGELIIGIEQEFDNLTVLYSELNSVKGIRVSGLIDSDSQNVTNCIYRSIQNFKIELKDYTLNNDFILRDYFENFCFALEVDYQMKLIYSDNSKLHFQKNISKGRLLIGIGLDESNNSKVFSQFDLNKGIEVSVLDNSDISQVYNSIRKSISPFNIDENELIKPIDWKKLKERHQKNII